MTTKKTDETTNEQQVEATEQESPQDAPEAAQEPQDTTQEPEPDDEPDDSKLSREAAKYRVRAKTAEAERDAATAQVEQLQRGAVEHIAGTAGRLSAPEILWAGGTQVADLLDDDGQIDSAKVLVAADEAALRFGVSRTPRPNPAQRESGAAPRPNGAQGMVNAIRNRR